jgi:hypothetical protein
MRLNAFLLPGKKWESFDDPELFFPKALNMIQLWQVF